jgi:hypothetical protein
VHDDERGAAFVGDLEAVAGLPAITDALRGGVLSTAHGADIRETTQNSWATEEMCLRG